MMQIKHGSPLPLYHQIANILRSRIDVREWSPGEQLPAESALAASFGVSPMTVRQALSLLVQEGRLQRRQGLGTFVTEQPESVDRVRLTVPFHEVTSGVVGLKVQLLDVEQVRGPRQILGMLGVQPGETAVRIRRVRLSGNRAMSYAIAYLPDWLGQALSPEDLGNPLLIDALESRSGVYFKEANQTIEASLADEDTASVLHMAVGAPVLLVQRTYELEDGRIAYVAINRYPSHLFRYEVRLIRQESNRKGWHVSPGE